MMSAMVYYAVHTNILMNYSNEQTFYYELEKLLHNSTEKFVTTTEIPQRLYRNVGTFILF
jgi:hypothetical protein